MQVKNALNQSIFNYVIFTGDRGMPKWFVPMVSELLDFIIQESPTLQVND